MAGQGGVGRLTVAPQITEQVQHDRRSQQCRIAEREPADRSHVLFEQNTLVGHMLVDQSQSFRIYRHDEAGIHLPEGL